MSAPMPTLDELLERNKVVAQTHKAPPHIGSLPREARPFPKILVVTCADPRCEPAYFFATRPGEAIFLRTMGGRVETVLPDILSMDVLFGFKQIIVVHHTDCGCKIDTQDFVRQELNKVPGADPKAIEALTLPNFTDDEKALRDDVKFLKELPLLRKELADSVHGLLLDTFTGLLKPVV